MIAYNIYFGTIGNKLGVKYRYTNNFKNEQAALSNAKNAASSFFYKNEGRYGIPKFSDISKEAEITGLSIDILYQDHINDFMRWYAIPTADDTVSSDDLKW